MPEAQSSPPVWPGHLRVGSLRFVRSSVHYESTIAFYRDLLGLPVIDEFQGSYGEDGTIFGLPSWPNHLEIVRSHADASSIDAFDQIVFYLPDEGAVAEVTRRLRDGGIHPMETQHSYWDDWGGVTFQDPDGRGVIFVSWVYGPQL
jgi:catechol 2,3-dioxygenase-like lactoylglutathione lyase family enzyme